MTTYAKAVQKHFEAKGDLTTNGPLSRQWLAVDEIASKLDRLFEEQVEDAKHAAEKFARYAASLAEGRTFDAPFGYSSLRDMERRAGEIAALESAFSTVLALTFTIDERKALLREGGAA